MGQDRTSYSNLSVELTVGVSVLTLSDIKPLLDKNLKQSRTEIMINNDI